ncbi:Hypothetical protein A7982_03648 [Minicystis rosea]|nr:Hypothetical protein A7982_03648 [Minicystis rosea]
MMAGAPDDTLGGLLPPSFSSTFLANGTFGRIRTATCLKDETYEQGRAREALEIAEERYRAGGLTGQQSLQLREEIDRLSKIARPGMANAWPPLNEAEVQAIADQRRALNTVGIFAAGPVMGALPAAARIAGAPEPVVEAAAQINFDLATSGALHGLPKGTAEPIPMARTITGTYIEPHVGKRIIKINVDAFAEGRNFRDTNQEARSPEARDPNRETPIAERVKAKEEAYFLKKGEERAFPNGNMATAHAEIGALQQINEAGLAKGNDILIIVSGERDVCSFCVGDIAAMGREIGARSITVIDVYQGKTFFWTEGMRSIGDPH